MKDDYSTFFLAFMGKPVTITTKSNYTRADSHSKETMPIFYEGILLDMDDEFYFLGETIDGITQAIPKSVVLNIMHSESVNVFNEILKDMPDPDGENEIN